MPAAATIVPAVMGIAGMVSQNAQNKAAQKNNDNANASAVANAKAAYDQAQTALNPYLQAGAAPSGGVVGRPTGMTTKAAPPPQQVNAASLLANLGGASSPQQPAPMQPQSMPSPPNAASGPPQLDIAQLIQSFRRPL